MRGELDVLLGAIAPLSAMLCSSALCLSTGIGGMKTLSNRWAVMLPMSASVSACPGVTPHRAVDGIGLAESARRASGLSRCVAVVVTTFLFETTNRSCDTNAACHTSR